MSTGTEYYKPLVARRTNFRNIARLVQEEYSMGHVLYGHGTLLRYSSLCGVA